MEMEAAALYAFAQAKSQNVICFAHVTNQMGNVENDFEKGGLHALRVIGLAAQGWPNRVGDGAVANTQNRAFSRPSAAFSR